MGHIFLVLQALPDEKPAEKIMKPPKAVAASAGWISRVLGHWSIGDILELGFPIFQGFTPGFPYLFKINILYKFYIEWILFAVLFEQDHIASTSYTVGDTYEIFWDISKRSHRWFDIFAVCRSRQMGNRTQKMLRPQRPPLLWMNDFLEDWGIR